MAQRYSGDGRGREGGRAKGTPNKATAAAKEALTRMLCTPKALKQMQADMAKLQPHQRLQIQVQLLAYVMPKQQAVQADVKADVEGMSFADWLIKTGTRKAGNDGKE